ncbi:MAG: hypothetical protein OEX02_19015, partial [Cyclobacteriaceae bacterium]|nr:hypothetical protein [Cyclobacteriaceae bacterium]
QIQKLFPVNMIGGPAVVAAYYGPYKGAGIQFIPMGGINAKNIRNYILLPGVLAIGGSWLASSHLIETKQFIQIEKYTKEVLALV